ncbi:MAG: MarR family transcriptional regulator [Candidatus Thermoplasmatota archaeon]|nr:MarR family transcriptional regulator [Candidatus Thermoplasmatota archaeon]MBS3789540.1 MarR family transcriptional regulator [Candidatus Thermoplasmatota archaeon]
MKVLRDKSKMTKFLVLYKSAVERPSRLADLASELDMSEQAVSNYISKMEEEGLIDRSGSFYRPTSEGMELVREVVSKLGSFLDEASDKINFISTCTAIASENIREGEKVGLQMENGFLRASLEESASMGTALNSVEKGQPLRVGGLQGITEMNLGELYLLEEDIDGDAREKAEALQSQISSIEYDKLAIMGEMEYGLCNIISLKPDIQFAPVDSAINAAEKGLDVLLMLSKNDLDEVLEKLNDRNRELEEEYKIDYTVL